MYKNFGCHVQKLRFTMYKNFGAMYKNFGFCEGSFSCISKDTDALYIVAFEI